MHRPPRQAPPYDPAAVLRLLARQSGVVSRAQLAGLDVTPADIRRFLRQRLLFRLGPGVYADRPGAPGPLARAWWACLHYGHAAVADESALELARHRDGRHLTLPVHVAVGAGRNVATLPGVEVHHVTRLEAVTAEARPPRMLAAVAALRVASRAADENALVTVVADAVNRRLTTPAALRAALHDLPTLRQRALLREVLADLATGACSVLERAYLRQVERAHGLPAGTRQQPRRTPEGREFRDVVYRRHGLVVELDGRAFHSGKRAWDNDHERDLDEMVARRDTARLGWRQVLGSSCRTAWKVGLLLRQRGWGGSVRACGPGCLIGD